MRITVTSNAAVVAKEWKRLSKEYQKTVVSGLNKTAFRVANEEMTGIMEKGIDRPVAFTKNKPAYYRRARVNNPVAIVGIKDRQAEYLQTIVYGGRGQKGKAVPVGIRLNKFGNIASLKDQKKINQLLAKPNVFAATYSGVSGVFERQGRRLKMLIYFSEGNYKYRKQFDWHKSVRKVVDKVITKAMNEAINKTIKRYAVRALT